MDFIVCQQVALHQLALDFNCKVSDFEAQNPSVVISKLNQGCKKYFRNPHFCQLAFVGNQVIASVEPVFENDMKTYLNDYVSFRSLDMPQLLRLNEELKKYGQGVGYMSEYYLPDQNVKTNLNNELEIKIFVADEILPLYEDNRFQMALCYDCVSDRRDELAVVGYLDGKLAGVAGASNDCETMWQVGIDVLPEFRGQRVASTLTKVLTDEILKKFVVPFYGCAWSNIASKKVAKNAGYKLAWIEVGARSLSEVNKFL